MKEYTAEEILYKICAYCSLAEHCESEVRQKLTAWGYSEPSAQEAVLTYLRQENYLSDERYCRAYIRDKMHYQGWGQQKIRMMLSLKNLPKETIAAAMEEIEQHEFQQSLQDILCKKARTLCGTDDIQASLQHDSTLRLRLMRFAASRGFAYHDIEKALAQI